MPTLRPREIMLFHAQEETIRRRAPSFSSTPRVEKRRSTWRAAILVFATALRLHFVSGRRRPFRVQRGRSQVRLVTIDIRNRGVFVKPAIYLRIAAVLTLIHCLGHTVQSLLNGATHGPQETAVIHVMQSTTFKFAGVNRSYW